MKKILGIVVLGLLLSGNANANYFNQCTIGGDTVNFTIDLNSNTIVGKSPKLTRTYQIESSTRNEIKTVKTPFVKSDHIAFQYIFNASNKSLTSIRYKNKNSGYNELDESNTFYCSNVSFNLEKQKKIEMAFMINKAKDTCKSLGFKEGTEKFADCSLKLYSQSVELAAEQNKQVIMQPQSSGSNVITIYDPVRDSNALMNKGMKMLSGKCTLGIDC